MTAVDTTSKFVEVLSRGTVHSCSVANQNQFSFFYLAFFVVVLTIIDAVMKFDDNIEFNFLQRKLQFFSIHSNFLS